MQTSGSYLFLEAAILIFSIGLWKGNWQNGVLSGKIRLSVTFFFVWFVIDQIALYIGLWSFPEGATLPFRLAGLPIEEYILFILQVVLVSSFINIYHQGAVK